MFEGGSETPPIRELRGTAAGQCRGSTLRQSLCPFEIPCYRVAFRGLFFVAAGFSGKKPGNRRMSPTQPNLGAS